MEFTAGRNGLSRFGTDMGQPRNAAERGFLREKDGIPDNVHEILFGLPGEKMKTSQSTPYIRRMDWATELTRENLTRVSENIQWMQFWQEQSKYMQRIAPVRFTDDLEFARETEIFSDGMAEPVGYAGPVSDVTRTLIKETTSTTMYGKGLTIHAKNLNEKSGIREFITKLSQVSNAMSMADFSQFLLKLQTQNYATKEILKRKHLVTAYEHYEYEEKHFDSFRKATYGMHKSIADMQNDASLIGGRISDVLVPSNIMSQLRMNDEYLMFYKAGKDKTVLDRKSSFNDMDGAYIPIAGMNISVIRDFPGTTQDRYSSYLANYVQFGGYHCIANIVDEGYLYPRRYSNHHWNIEIYDQHKDENQFISYEQALKYCMLFDADGNIRDIESRQGGTESDYNDDPFLRFDKKVGEPIQIMGEIRSKESNWLKVFAYASKTMGNSLTKQRLEITTLIAGNIKDLFDELNNIPARMDQYQKFLEANLLIENLWNGIDAGPGEDEPRHYRTRTENIEALTPNKYDGFYNFPITEDGLYFIPWGCGNMWGLRAISRLSTEKVIKSQQKLVERAQKYYPIFRTLMSWARKHLPKCDLIQEYKKYAPHYLKYPRPEDVYAVNCLYNPKNTIWLKKPSYTNIFQGFAYGQGLRNQPRGFQKFVEKLKNQEFKVYPVERGLGDVHLGLNGFLDGLGTFGMLESEEDRPPAIQQFFDILADSGYGADDNENMRRYTRNVGLQIQELFAGDGAFIRTSLTSVDRVEVPFARGTEYEEVNVYQHSETPSKDSQGLAYGETFDPYVVEMLTIRDTEGLYDKVMERTGIFGSKLYQSIRKETHLDNAIERSFANLLFLTPCNLSNLLGCYHGGVMPLVELILFRPFFWHRVYPIIGVKDNGDSIVRYHGISDIPTQ